MLRESLYALCFILIAQKTYGSCPRIVFRSEWGAQPALTRSLEVHPPTHVVLHHSATPTCNSLVNCAAIVRSIQKKHIKYEHKNDIGYNFLVGEDGNIFEGVGWGKQGMHEDRLNSRSIGICIIGDYTSWLPNDKALDAVKRIIECGVEEGHLNPRYKLVAHRQVNHTECPGLKLLHHIWDWPNWSPSP